MQDSPDNDRASELNVELAKTVMTVLQDRVPGWRRAFVRFEASDSHSSSNGSFVTDSGVLLFDVLQFKDLFSAVNLLGPQLRQALTNQGKMFCVFLLTVDSEFQFDFDYEWRDSNRWRITKMGGASGIPAGVAAP